jgi:Flp pilus assembly protein TadD
MKNILLGLVLFSTVLALSGCTTNNDPQQAETAETVQTEKSLNDYMLVFQEKMEAYVVTEEKSLKDLEQLHLSFLPILKWEGFVGDEDYKAAALSVGSIVHKMEEAEDEEYEALKASLAPAFAKFHEQY